MDSGRIRFCGGCDAEMPWDAAKCYACGQSQGGGSAEVTGAVPHIPTLQPITVRPDIGGLKRDARPLSEKQGVLLIGLLSVILLVQVFAHVASATAGMAADINRLATRPRYEYAVWSTPDESLRTALDKRGQAGWRVVGSRRATSGPDGFRSASYELILMRETHRD